MLTLRTPTSRSPVTSGREKVTASPIATMVPRLAAASSGISSGRVTIWIWRVRAARALT